MGTHLSSYWKKPGQHKSLSYIDARIVIRSFYQDLPLVEKSYIYEGQVIPNRMIKEKNVYEIVYLHPMFYINGFLVITENDMVKTITLFGYHPNRDPKTNLYCLPDYKKGVKYNEIYFERLLTNIKTYYLDDCFYTPGKSHVQYKKLRSVAIQFSKENN